MSESPRRPEWLLIMSGAEVDRNRWLRSFPDNFDPTVSEHGDQVLVRIQALQSLPSESEVRERGLPMLARLNGAMSTIHRCLPLTFEGVGHFDTDGELKRTAFATIGPISLRIASGFASAVALGPDGIPLPPPPPKPSEVQEWFARTQKDEDVADLLYHLGKADDWYGLYKAIEMMERIAGGERQLRQNLGDEIPGWKNLRTTANFYRHARAHRPSNMIGFDEAKDKVRQCAMKVLSGQ